MGDVDSDNTLKYSTEEINAFVMKIIRLKNQVISSNDIDGKLNEKIMVTNMTIKYFNKLFDTMILCDDDVQKHAKDTIDPSSGESSTASDSDSTNSSDDGSESNYEFSDAEQEDDDRVDDYFNKVMDVLVTIQTKRNNFVKRKTMTFKTK
jgi:hypothetical protein